MADEARAALAAIADARLERPLRILNVCGGHERTIAMAGLRQVLPSFIELIPGPGCPVCVCPEEDVRLAARIAAVSGATVFAFGDMMRVPFHAPKSEPRSLAETRAAGADIRPIASPREAVESAREEGRPAVLFAVGFETTAAPIAAAMAEGAPDNLSILVSARRTAPAVRLLLEDGSAGFDALVAPGHVATIMGPEEWAFVAETHRLPTAVAGFTAASLLAAIRNIAEQVRENRAVLHNAYPLVARRGGNPAARRLLETTFQTVDAPWRGIGTIAASGFALREESRERDARVRYGEIAAETEAAPRQMPPGCDCARVILGKVKPTDCALYGRACTPRAPIGPCMVSDEGACRIWWSAGARPDGVKGPARHAAA